MSELTPASEAIAGLLADGWNYAQIGRALGVNGSLVRQAIAPSPGQRQKPLAKYVPALQGLQGKKPGTKPTALPAGRTTKGGKAAGVRKGLKSVNTKQGKQHTAARVKNGPVTLKRAIAKAAKAGAGLRWDINFKRIKTMSDQEKRNAWVSGQLPDGWTAQTLLDRINNPSEEEGDTWAAGDVNGALVAIALEQNEGSIVSATGPQDYSLFSTD
jgi:hypothetical protein